MKACVTCFTILIIFSLGNLQAQTKFKERVNINIYEKVDADSSIKFLKQEEYSLTKGYDIWVINYRTKKDTLELKKGDRLITEIEKTNKGKTYTVKTDSIVMRDTVMIFESKEKYSSKAEIDPGTYSANIYASNDTLYVNFWLETINDSTYYDYKNPEESDFQFLPTKKYFITLKNRQSAVFWGHNLEIAAVTIPFKLSFGYEKDNVEVPAEFNTGVNISTFIGRRLTRHSYRYDTFDKMVEKESSFSVGAVLGVSSIEVDSSSTYLSANPVLSKKNVPVFNAGLGAIVNIGDFNLGLFYGYDFGIGKSAAKWNFHQKPWLGFGFGYKVALFTKSE